MQQKLQQTNLGIDKVIPLLMRDRVQVNTNMLRIEQMRVSGVHTRRTISFVLRKYRRTSKCILYLSLDILSIVCHGPCGRCCSEPYGRLTCERCLVKPAMYLLSSSNLQAKMWSLLALRGRSRGSAQCSRGQSASLQAPIHTTGACDMVELPFVAHCGNTLSCINAGVVLFFYLLSYHLTSVMEKQFYLDKVCLSNQGHNTSVCSALGDGNHTSTQVSVQRQVANFLIYNNLVRQVLPVIPGFLLAMWTDRHGARTAIVIGMIGKTVYFIGYVINAHFFIQWPVEYILLTAALPRALAGYDVAIFMGVQSHLAQATPPEKLTMRLAILETANQVSAPVGLSLGSYIFTATGRSYTVSYTVSAAVSGFGLIYALLFLRNLDHYRNNDTPISCADIHLLSAIKTTCRRRPDRSHRLILLLLAMIFCQSMMYDLPLLYLYTQLVFHWDTANFSNFATVETCCGILACALIVPTLNKRPGISDIWVLTGGVLMTITSRLCYALTNQEWLMYLGAFASSFQILILVSIRSMVSKITTTEDRGKVLSLFTSIESGVALLSSPLYSQIYSATIVYYPSTIFFISIFLQCCILTLIPVLRMAQKNQSPKSEEESNNDNE